MRNKKVRFYAGVFIIIIGVFSYFLSKNDPEYPANITKRLFPYFSLALGVLLVLTSVRNMFGVKKVKQLKKIKANVTLPEDQEIKNARQTASEINTIGVDPEIAKQFKEAYTLLSRDGADIVEDKELIHKIEDKFVKNDVIPHAFGFSTVLSVGFSDLSYYFLFVKIGFPYPSMRFIDRWHSNYFLKEDSYQDTEEYQVWGFAELNKDYGKILISEKEFEDSVDHFFTQFNDKSIATEQLTRKIIGQFIFIGEESDIGRFLNQSIIQTLQNVNKEIRAFIDQDAIIFGIPHTFSIDRVIGLCDFFKAIQSTIRSSVE